MYSTVTHYFVVDIMASVRLSAATVGVREDVDSVSMNRPYSEQPDCQRCIREGLCSSDGDTEDRDMLERLRY